MRVWRKIESAIVTSDSLAKVSDSAKWLFTLLLVAQDDEGKYPWTPTMVRSLTVTTTWDYATSDALLSELRVANVAALREGFVILRNGAEKNGTPANSKKYVMLYPPPNILATPYDESLTIRGRVANDSDAIVQSRVEKSRVEKITPVVPLKGDTQTSTEKPVVKTSKARVAMKPLSEAERKQLHDTFKLYWNPSEIDEMIEEMENVKSFDKHKSAFLTLRNWFKLRLNREGIRNGRKPEGAPRKPSPFADYGISVGPTEGVRG